MYVNPENRRKDKDINKSKNCWLCVTETSECLQVKWSPVKRDNKVKKEQVIEFYQDICSEIAQQEQQEVGAFVIECKED